MLQYYVSDLLGDWVATHKRSGEYPDYSTGHTFTVVVKKDGAVFTTKTTNITGAANGVVTVSWVAGDIPAVSGQYPVRLKITRTAGGKPQTIGDVIEVIE